MSGPVRARLSDGRWHFQHGPIDLVIGADGDSAAVAASVEACWQAFQDVLPELVSELAQLRSPCTPALRLRGPVAWQMLRACRPFAEDLGLFVTPMAAVAGAVADHLISHFARPGVARAYINNGGDIALHLTEGAAFDIGVVSNVEAPSLSGGLRVEAGDAVRGVATSGWRGRSFSLGIADSVTVLAANAAAADAAATMIANHVDVDSPLIRRAPANSLRDDTDLGDRLVTVHVPPLVPALVHQALDRGAAFARTCLERGLIRGALLTVQGASRILTEDEIAALA
jgi:ApbE superfamily uncharacterized protein (UPF0280 family)